MSNNCDILIALISSHILVRATIITFLFLREVVQGSISTANQACI